ARRRDPGVGNPSSALPNPPGGDAPAAPDLPLHGTARRRPGEGAEVGPRARRRQPHREPRPAADRRADQALRRLLHGQERVLREALAALVVQGLQRVSGRSPQRGQDQPEAGAVHPARRARADDVPGGHALRRPAGAPSVRRRGVPGAQIGGAHRPRRGVGERGRAAQGRVLAAPRLGGAHPLRRSLPAPRAQRRRHAHGPPAERRLHDGPRRGHAPRALSRRLRPRRGRLRRVPRGLSQSLPAGPATAVGANWASDRGPYNRVMGSPAADFVAFDLETTGLSPKSDRVIEIGAVRLGPDLRIRDRFEMLVDPAMSIPLAVQRLTGLSERDVQGNATPEEAMAQFADFSQGARLVAHGGIFDMAFCAALLPQAFANRAVFDTLDLARILMPVAPSHSLPLLSEQLDIEHDRPHRALSDAETTAELFRILVDVAEQLPASLLALMRQVAAEAPGPLDDFFAGVVSGEPSPASHISRAGAFSERRGDLSGVSAPVPDRIAMAATGTNGHAQGDAVSLPDAVA